jgi:hypothetical protein
MKGFVNAYAIGTFHTKKWINVFIVKNLARVKWTTMVFNLKINMHLITHFETSCIN